MTTTPAIAPPRVLNIRQTGYRVPRAVYVGRKNRQYGLPESKWANPFKPLRHTVEEHARVVALYEQHLRTSGLIVHVSDLRGLNLVCWCAPDLPCHGDVLLRLANERASTGGAP